jgi:3-methyladenine DNA glycosylase/8-oxoguanine DNA glycosylase
LEDTLYRLCVVRGISEHLAHYISMRAFGEPDAFPASALGLRRILGNNRIPVSSAELRRIADTWRPWRAYAAMHLWAADAEAGSRRRTVAGRLGHLELTRQRSRNERAGRPCALRGTLKTQR